MKLTNAQQRTINNITACVTSLKKGRFQRKEFNHMVIEGEDFFALDIHHRVEKALLQKGLIKKEVKTDVAYPIPMYTLTFIL